MTIPRRHLLAVALLALAVSAAGCGGGGDSDSTSISDFRAREQAEAHNDRVREEYRERQAAAAPNKEELKAQAVAADFYAVLRAASGTNKTEVDSRAFCELMSKQAQSQTVRYAELSSGVQREWDCESAVNFLILRSKRSGDFRRIGNARVITVNAHGDDATASVSFADGSVTSVSMVKEDGEWKLAAPPAPSTGAVDR